MRPLILVNTVPDGAITHVSLEVFDSTAAVGTKSMYLFKADIDRRTESRPDWSAVYACRILRGLVERLEQELETDGVSLREPGRVRQSTIQRASRWTGAYPGVSPTEL